MVKFDSMFIGSTRLLTVRLLAFIIYTFIVIFIARLNCNGPQYFKSRLENSGQVRGTLEWLSALGGGVGERGGEDERGIGEAGVRGAAIEASINYEEKDNGAADNNSSQALDERQNPADEDFTNVSEYTRIGEVGVRGTTLEASINYEEKDNGAADNNSSQVIDERQNPAEEGFTNVETAEKSVRILCWLMTDPAILGKATYARDTWTRRCDIRLFMSSKDDRSFPTIGLNVSAGRSFIAAKSKASWTYVYEHHRNDADFFVKADPDSYVVIENLKEYLANYDTTEPAIFGHNMYYDGDGFRGHYVAGEAIVLTRESLVRLVTKAIPNPTCFPPGEAEDLKTCRCLLAVGGYVMDTRDQFGKETFLPPVQLEHIAKGLLPDWYTGSYRKPYGYCNNVGCLSDRPIAFHYVMGRDFYLLDYLFKIQGLQCLSSSGPSLASCKEFLEGYRSQLRFNGTRLTD